MARPKLYHGTSSALPIGKMLQPAVETGVLREHWRKKDVDVVFLAGTYGAARMYAKKAVAKYGGRPVVLTCRPIGLLTRTHNGEYMASKAVITRKDVL